MAVIVEPLTTLTWPAGLPPTVTVAPATNAVPVPLIVIGVPPLVGPDAGETDAIDGPGVV